MTIGYLKCVSLVTEESKIFNLINLNFKKHICQVATILDIASLLGTKEVHLKNASHLS